jgi:uncharacterized membrane protein
MRLIEAMTDLSMTLDAVEEETARVNDKLAEYVKTGRIIMSDTVTELMRLRSAALATKKHMADMVKLIDEYVNKIGLS